MEDEILKPAPTPKITEISLGEFRIYSSEDLERTANIFVSMLKTKEVENLFRTATNQKKTKEYCG